MANNFSADSNCKALWRFENGALTTDSKGTNTLTNNNAVVADTVNYKEGAASADFEATSSQYMSITDASLNSGFPFRSDDTNKVGSVCVWVNLESIAAVDSSTVIFAKYDGGAANKRSFMLDILNVSGNGRLRFILGYNTGISFETYTHGTNLSLNTWYHFTATYENSGKTYSLRIKDVNGNTVGTDLSGTATLDINKLNVEDCPLNIGAYFWESNPYGYHDGLIDELVVFDDVITAAEATQIAKGVYGTIPIKMYHYQHNTGSGV